MKLQLSHRSEAGNLLLLSALMLAILAFVAAGVLQSVVPRFHLTYQVAGWQEARHAAEAGVDFVMGTLQSSVKQTPDGEVTTPWHRVDASGEDIWKVLDGNNTGGEAVAEAFDFDTATLSTTGTTHAVKISKTVHLNKLLQITPPGGLPAFVDVQVNALYPDLNDKKRVWYRIRSLGVSGLPGPARTPFEKLDVLLRGFNAHLKKELDHDNRLAAAIPPPRATRLVEVLAKPIYSFEQAILTESEMVLGQSNRWEVDSFNSDYGPYNPATPGSSGHIASNLARPEDSPYGPLIDANGTKVTGSVSTNGGDDPDTETIHENVADAQRINPENIYSDFYADLVDIKPDPEDLGIAKEYVPGQPLDPETGRGSFYYYESTTKPLGSFAVSGTTASGGEFGSDPEKRGKITIFVKADIDLGSGNDAYIRIPKNVDVVIYAFENINFGNGMVNTGELSSNIPGQLRIYGVKPQREGEVREIGSQGNPQIAAVFYGPDYNAIFKGTAEWYGSLVSNTYRISGAGFGGVHYDEANNEDGEIIGYRIGRYFEDSRHVLPDPEPQL